MLEYIDFYGGDITQTDEIKNATTREELAEILERKRSQMEDMLADANSHLDNFKKRIGLHIL